MGDENQRFRSYPADECNRDITPVMPYQQRKGKVWPNTLPPRQA